MNIRKGEVKDIQAVAGIYNAIHDEIEQGRYRMKWFRELYPTRGWAEEHIAAGDLYVMEDEGKIVASAVINHTPLPEYFIGKWHQPDNYDTTLVLHTLVVDPREMRRGYATTFMNFFEHLAIESGCQRLRLDTQMIDIPARQLYKKLGYTEADYVLCQFKGITDIDLVLIEKVLMKRLEEMSLEELWQLFPIVLIAPDNRWQTWADEEISKLKKELQIESSAIHHIGSTAIKGIWAKPIIDLLLEANSRADLLSLKPLIISAGYICMNETETRIDFNKGYTPHGFAERVFHLHLRLAGDCDEIYFRDYLNENPEVAKEYERLKLSLRKQFEHDRDGYTEAKSDFVRHYTAIAKSKHRHDKK